jgi:DNA polymerase
MLKEMGLTPVWRLRVPATTGSASGLSSAGVVPAARVMSSAGASPAAKHIQGIHERGYLPHLKAAAATYFVTFRLADSLPDPVLRQLEEVPAAERSRRTEEYLDAGHGEKLLQMPEIADIVRKSLLRFNGERYRLHAWVIMPNHVHLLIEPIGDHSLSETLQAMKSVTGHEVNKLLQREGRLWQPESYDHLVRDQGDFDRCREYILQNPVKAKLVSSPERFAYSSAALAAGEAPALLTPAAGGTPALHTPAAGEAPALLTDDDRRAAIMRMDWPALKEAVAQCFACPLHAKRTNTVFGVGDENADWMFVGEGPGADEDALGDPFVGQAGKLLDNMLAAIELKRGRNVYIANVVKCRPPGNRNPEPAEALKCEPFLQRQIALIKPKLIIALGRIAAVNLLGRDASVASMRGKVLDYNGVPLIVTYHPAYLLRSLTEKAKAWEDLCFAVKTMTSLQTATAAPT